MKETVKVSRLETARIIIYDRHGDVVLGQRPFGSNKRSGQLDFFGGRVDPGESSYAAALREVRQESGIDLTGTSVEHVLSWPDQDGSLRILRDYYAAYVELLPVDISSEHIGSTVLPAVVAYDTLQAFPPHQIALDMALARMLVA